MSFRNETQFTNLLVDLDLMVEHIKFARKLSQTDPFKSEVLREVDPGPECVTDEDMKGHSLFSICLSWNECHEVLTSMQTTSGSICRPPGMQLVQQVCFPERRMVW